MLSNLFKVSWKWKNVDSTFDKLTSLVSRKCQKIQKLDENWWKYLTLTKKFFISSKRSKEFQWKFQTRCALDNIESHKKTGFHPPFRRYIFPKTTGGVKFIPPSRFRVWLSPSNLCFICFNESSLERMKNDFYFILKSLFVLKVFKFLSWLFGHV